MLGILLLFFTAESSLRSYSTSFTDCTASQSASFTALSVSPYPFKSGKTEFKWTVDIFIGGTYTTQIDLAINGVPQNSPFTLFTDVYSSGEVDGYAMDMKVTVNDKTPSGQSFIFELASGDTILASCNIPLKVDSYGIALAFLGSFLTSLLI